MTIKKAKITEIDLLKVIQVVSGRITFKRSPHSQTSDLQRKTLTIGTVTWGPVSMIFSLSVFFTKEVQNLSVTCGAHCNSSSLASLCFLRKPGTEPSFLQIFQLNWIAIGYGKILRLHTYLILDGEMGNKGYHLPSIYCSKFCHSPWNCQWVSNSRVPQNHLQGLWRPEIAGPHPQSFWLRLAFLVCSQVRLTLLVQGPYLEDHWHRHIYLHPLDEPRRMLLSSALYRRGYCDSEMLDEFLKLPSYVRSQDPSTELSGSQCLCSFRKQPRFPSIGDR